MRHALLSGFPVRSRSHNRYFPKRATIGEPGHGNIKSLSKLKNETRKSGSDGLGFFWMSAVLWSDSPAAMDIWDVWRCGEERPVKKNRIDPEHSVRFAREWILAWNRHELERILERYDNSVEFTSPTLPG